MPASTSCVIDYGVHRRLSLRKRRTTGSKAQTKTLFIGLIDRVIATAARLESESASRPVFAEWLGSLTYGNRKFRLQHATLCVVTVEDGIWTHEIPQLKLSGYGPSERESRNALSMALAASWDDIAAEDDSALTLDAQQLKALLRSTIRDVR